MCFNFSRVIDFFYSDNDLICIFLNPPFEHAQQRFLRVSTFKTKEFQRFLKAVNAHGCNVYLSIYPLIKRGKRTEDNVIDMVDRVFFDFDLHDSYEAFKRDFKPTLTINTSPGKYQCFLKLSNGVFKTDVKKIARALSRKYGGDYCYDLARVFRLPTFRNHKYKEKPLVILSEFNPEIVYDPLSLPIEPLEIKIDEIEKPIQVQGFQSNKIQVHDYLHFLGKAPLRADGTIDLSCADIAYVIHLLSCGLKSSEVRTKLLQNSIDIQKRKGRYIDRYIERTINLTNP